MGNKMSKKMIELIIHLIKKFKLIDSVLIFMIITGYFDFGFIQCIMIIIYIVYKIYSSNNSNFYNKVAFS